MRKWIYLFICLFIHLFIYLFIYLFATQGISFFLLSYCFLMSSEANIQNIKFYFKSRFQTTDYIEVNEGRVSISSMWDICGRRQLGTDHTKEQKTWKNLSRKTNHSFLIMEKEYFSIKISRYLIFHLVFSKKSALILLKISGSEPELEQDCKHLYPN